MDRQPLLFFTVPGFGIAVAGLAFGIDEILTYTWPTTLTFYPAKMMVSGFLTVTGAVGIFSGFVLNSFANQLAPIELSE